MAPKRVYILGTRGIPASHGGFETFAERLSLYLAEKGWAVRVYCQEVGKGPVRTSSWRGVELVHIPTTAAGTIGTMIFDFKSAVHAAQSKSCCLVLGYNTAIFNLLQRFCNAACIINMDGIEWRRGKWGRLAKAWFWMNERAGCLIGNHLVADHPAIASHLATRTSPGKITMIPYGADVIDCAALIHIQRHGLVAGTYFIVIARPEPENSVLEIVRAFSRRPRGYSLVVLGQFDPDNNRYHHSVVSSASDEVMFLGAIYDVEVVAALRFHARCYVHGHTVGGTNPSLVEAMGAGNPIVAHDNVFNRWVAGSSARFFEDEAGCASIFDELCMDSFSLEGMRDGSLAAVRDRFHWESVLLSYERLLSDFQGIQGSGGGK